MGMHQVSRSSYDEKKHVSSSSYSSFTKVPQRAKGNPDPKNFVVLDRWPSFAGPSANDMLVLKVRYPDCTNFEGNKILVFQGVTMGDLSEQGSMDPHFCDNAKFHSPIARFEPTEEGWRMAKCFCKAWLKERQ